MPCRGVFFALTKDEEDKLVAASDSNSVVNIVHEEVEAKWDEAWLQPMDKSWDAIHRCLGDGSLRTSQQNISAKAVLGGRQLSSRDDQIVSYLDGREVIEVAKDIAALDKKEFRKRYFALSKKFLWFDRTEYAGPIDEQDFEYSWSYFDDMRLLYSKAAAANRAMIFSVDQ